MKLVILESPYAGDHIISTETNIHYARLAVRDSLLRGEAPLASHLLYTQPAILNDEIPTERAQGIAAGHAWIKHAEAMVVYTDNGISPGMLQGIAKATALNIPIEYRSINKYSKIFSDANS